MNDIEVRINKEVRDYQEGIFFGLTLRQFLCALGAVAVALAVYFFLGPALGGADVGWACVLAAAPFALCGFFQYNGMKFERFLLVVLRAELLYPRRLVFRAENLYAKALENSTIKEALYRPLIEGLGGEVVSISATSPNHINAMDMEQGYCQEMEAKFGIPVTAADSVREAVHNADIICTVTPSWEPYLEAGWIAPGTHINAVGAFTPTTREVTSALVAKSRLYADQVEAMRKECGEYLVPLREGLIGLDHIVGSLGGVLLGRVPGRSSEEEITLFDALGLAVEDVACVKYLCGESRS